MTLSILPQLLVNALIAGSIYALVSSGLSLSYGLLRIFNFAHGHLMMVGVYLFYWASVLLGLPLIPSTLLTAGIMALLAMLIMRGFITPFYRYNIILVFVTTLALANILEAGVSIIFDVNVKSFAGGAAAESMELFGVYVTPLQLAIIFIALVVMLILAVIVHYTAFGRTIRAVAENPAVAESLGVSQVRVSYFVFIAATLLAALSGVLVGYETNFQPTMGGSYTIKGFAAMVLGGLGSLWGTCAGAYLLGLIENLVIGLDFWGYSVPAGYKDAIAYLILLLVLLFKPEGLFGHLRRRA